MPSALRPAPSRAATPLPGSFTLTEDASTQEFDGGTVLLGGSPLRLFRISERARQLVERWQVRRCRWGPRRPAQLLARRLVVGRRLRPRGRGAAPSGPTTSRSSCRCATGRRSSTGYSTHSRGLACIVVDDASADAGATKEIAERHGARFVGLATNVGPAGRTQRWAWPRSHTALVAFVDSDCVPTDGWLEPLLGHFDDPLVAAVAPRIVAAPARRAARYEAARSSLDRGDRAGPGAAREPHPLRPERGAPGPSRRRDWDPTSSMLRSAAARTWTWSGGWPRPAGTCAMCRRAR